MESSSPTPPQPQAIYVWLVPSEHVLEQPGSWRIRKWDTAPFPEANYTLAAPSEKTPPASEYDAFTTWLREVFPGCRDSYTFMAMQASWDAGRRSGLSAPSAIGEPAMTIKVEGREFHAYDNVPPQFSPLERFALTILEDMREHVGDDIDGGSLQDMAEGCGLIHEVQADAPCNEHHCECAEISDFPVTCMRETEYLRPLLARHRKGQT